MSGFDAKASNAVVAITDFYSGELARAAGELQQTQATLSAAVAAAIAGGELRQAVTRYAEAIAADVASTPTDDSTPNPLVAISTQLSKMIAEYDQAVRNAQPVAGS